MHKPVSKWFKRKQARKGIIRSLRGKRTKVRSQLRADLLQARAQKGHIGKRVVPYIHLGQGRFSEYLHKVSPNFLNLLTQALERKDRVRVLDIGPGKAKYAGTMHGDLNAAFMSEDSPIDWRSRLDWHTLSPEQINPKWVRGEPVGKSLELTGGTIALRSIHSNPEHSDRITHHVAALETANVRSLGKFDFVFSRMGAINYSRQPVASIVKAARMLSPGGHAWFQYVEINASGNSTLHSVVPRVNWMNKTRIQKILGPNFEVHLTSDFDMDHPMKVQLQYVEIRRKR
ncbi:MAG: hypothetical protein Q7S92_05415 [Candidatus Diapherotrites archaeon]|nr:hypothetical protein [Candidatus Diapherotrites archaeon]